MDNNKYRIEFSPNILFKFRYKIKVNNDINKNVKHILDRAGADYNFYVNNHKATILLRVKLLSSACDLAIDGISAATKKPVQLFLQNK